MRHRHVAPAVLLLTLVFAGAVAAQQDPGRISNATITSDRPLTADQQKECTVTIDHWVARMATGNPDAVAQGRDRLIEPYNQAPKDYFQAFYSQYLAGKLISIADSKHLITRINVQLAAKPVKNVKIVDVIKIGLNDESPAVVYPAASSIASILEDPATKLELRLQMVKPLIAAVQKEKSGWVLEHLYQALIHTDEMPAIDAAAKKMTQRAGIHAAKLDGMVGPETQAVRTLSLKLPRLKLDSNKEIPAETLKLFGQALIVLADHATDVVSGNKVQGSAQTNYQNLIIVCDDAFVWLVRTGLGKTPPKALRGQNADGQRLTVLADWKRIGKEELKLTDAEMVAPKPAPAAPAPVKSPTETPAEAPANGN